jgi:hypothetical protein
MPEMWKIKGEERKEKTRELLRLLYNNLTEQVLLRFDRDTDEWDWDYDDGDEWSANPDYVVDWAEDEVYLKAFKPDSLIAELWYALKEVEHVPDENEVDSIILFMVKNKCDSLDDLKALSARLESEA